MPKHIDPSEIIPCIRPSIKSFKNTPEYLTWRRMMRRCNDPKHDRWKHYGGRGIIVCERWLNFSNFFADMGPKPTPLHSIDRYPNQDGNYEKSNCRWATRSQQERNKKTTHLVTFNNVTMCVTAWAETVGINSDVFASRLRIGWSVERALKTPPRKAMFSVAQADRK